ncbi:hypothetical protein DU490_16765 [Halomonas sp. DQ26W]|uniref:Wzz/FepE/Etk N-terminal domain-containing protein n=1 Tax=Halomonas sp. DQ26W TaxID=2282311 RepID=UPI000DF85FBE|nr:Wzz/FepE/Etk N-terminal domain-containing protein [Halomonas sp. DQ26W]RDB41755.1 hypothetical protein DU490_16765 [Halomonas sp. DQ26W]
MNAPVNHSPPRESDDEIDLRDIAIAIHDGWKWIAGSIAASLSIGLIYIYLITTPQYSTEITYTPSPGGLNALNNMPGTNYTETQAFEEFSQHLSSHENFKFFHKENPDHLSPLLESSQDEMSRLRSFFFGSLKINQPSQENGLSRKISLNYTKNIDGPQLINDYFRWTEETYVETLIARAQRAVDSTIARNSERMAAHLEVNKEDIEARIARLQEEDRVKIAELEDQLHAEKKSVISSREERIRILENAEQIADRLGIEKPTTPRDLGRQTHDRDVIYAEINSQGGLPLYFMGVEALKAEREVIELNLERETKTAEIRNIESRLSQLRNNRTIEALLNREELSPFSDEYNSLRSQNKILAANVVTKDEIDVVSAIHWAYQPNSQDSPKKGLSLVLSLIIGVMLGVILVFFSTFIKSIKHHKETHKERTI